MQHTRQGTDEDNHLCCKYLSVGYSIEDSLCHAIHTSPEDNEFVLQISYPYSTVPCKTQERTKRSTVIPSVTITFIRLWQLINTQGRNKHTTGWCCTKGKKKQTGNNFVLQNLINLSQLCQAPHSVLHKGNNKRTTII